MNLEIKIIGAFLLAVFFDMLLWFSAGGLLFHDVDYVAGTQEGVPCTDMLYGISDGINATIFVPSMMVAAHEQAHNIGYDEGRADAVTDVAYLSMVLCMFPISNAVTDKLVIM